MIDAYGDPGTPDRRGGWPPPTSSCGRPWPPWAPSGGGGTCPAVSTPSWAPTRTAPTARRPSGSPWPGWCRPTRTPLILDEATSLLGPATARPTERALAAVLVGRNVIAVAHRLPTAHDADRVTVMEGGRLTELGRHEELVAARGAYAALWDFWHGEPAPETVTD
ncbi:hypothetical protein GCM10010279_67720 [Streptomyces mutabilis]|nr:hypothetical protein GCM10010279_67720 [Streptomyces mutabilis]